jgi:hypothetical protein
MNIQYLNWKDLSRSSTVEEVYAEYFNDLREKVKKERTKENEKRSAVVQVRLATLRMAGLQFLS